MSALSVKVECLVYLFLCGRLVDADVTDAAQQREVDDAGRILLVVRHQFQEGGVVVAGNLHLAVMLLDEGDGLVHLVGGESRLGATQVEFADDAPGYGIAMKHRLAMEGKRLEGVTHGVTQVESLVGSSVTMRCFTATLSATIRRSSPKSGCSIS